MQSQDDSHRYDDIIHLPHHQSPARPHMPIGARAAQFAPFAALTGYSASIAETERRTEEKVWLDEYELEALDRTLQRIRAALPSHPTVRVTYFRPDDRKSGGTYLTTVGEALRIDEEEGLLVLTDGTAIPMAAIVELDMDEKISQTL